MDFLFKLMLPVIIMGGIILVISVWGSIHRSLGKSGQAKSEKLGDWAIFAFIGLIILLALIFGDSSSDYRENLPIYLQ